MGCWWTVNSALWALVPLKVVHFYPGKEFILCSTFLVYLWNSHCLEWCNCLLLSCSDSDSGAGVWDVGEAIDTIHEAGVWVIIHEARGSRHWGGVPPHRTPHKITSCTGRPQSFLKTFFVTQERPKWAIYHFIARQSDTGWEMPYWICNKNGTVKIITARPCVYAPLK